MSEISRGQLLDIIVRNAVVASRLIRATKLDLSTRFSYP